MSLWGEPMYVYYNPNPRMKRVGDCVIRAICKLTGEDWDTVYMGVALEGYRIKDMPSANHVWGEYLKRQGYRRLPLPDTCPECYTVEEFCKDYPKGRYLLATGSHVVTVIDGKNYDTWDSSDEVPIYFWTKGDS